MSTTESKIADSSMAGSADAAAMYSSISSGTSSSPYMSRILARTSSWYSRMCRSASISCAHRLSMTCTGPLPKMSRWNMSERLAWGSTLKTRTRLPCCASQKPVAALKVVLPRPPLPPNITYRRSGCSRKKSASDSVPVASVGAVATGRSVVVIGSEHRVREVLLPQHASLPGADLRHDVGEQAERIVRRQDRHTHQVAHGGQDEEVLHAGPTTQRVAGHVMGSHPIGDFAKLAEQPAQPA